MMRHLLCFFMLGTIVVSMTCLLGCDANDEEPSVPGLDFGPAYTTSDMGEATDSQPIAADGGHADTGTDAAAVSSDLGLPDWGQRPLDASSIPAALAHERDDELAFQHVQALGTHNSYHIEPELPVPAWEYTHLPLGEQLGRQGVRQFELDVFYDHETGAFEVYHLFVVDQETTCGTLGLCLEAMKDWSDQHPAHHPILVLLEIKGFNEDPVHLPLLRALEREIVSIWPWERLVYPDLVQGTYENLRDAIRARGWPSLGALRGRALFVLHTGGRLRDIYTHGLTRTTGRVMFPDSYGVLNLPISAYHSINSPLSGFERIQNAVNANHLVRTRADADGEQARALDYRQLEAALESGAHFISTDFPFPSSDERYGVTIPDGQPSRCNPITAPADCRPMDIEDPRIVTP